mgnify:CR=1 FL=1
MTTARMEGVLRSEFLERGEFVRLISQMPETYKVALLLSLETGLRISDVLGLTFSQVLWGAPVRERKTGKTVVLDVPAYLKAALWGWWLDRQRELVFESKKAPGRPVSRSTVYRWVRRVAQDEKAHVSPHTARKIFAVERFRECGSLEQVQEALRHDRPETTALYALSDKF